MVAVNVGRGPIIVGVELDADAGGNPAVANTDTNSADVGIKILHNEHQTVRSNAIFVPDAVVV